MAHRTPEGVKMAASPSDMSNQMNQSHSYLSTPSVPETLTPETRQVRLGRRG